MFVAAISEVSYFPISKVVKKRPDHQFRYSQYDQVLYEDSQVNRFEEALTVRKVLVIFGNLGTHSDSSAAAFWSSVQVQMVHQVLLHINSQQARPLHGKNCHLTFVRLLP